jgi:hypothetical protein
MNKVPPDGVVTPSETFRTGLQTPSGKRPAEKFNESNKNVAFSSKAFHDCDYTV